MSPTMVLVDDILREAGFSPAAIAHVKAGKLHQGGSLDAASERELSVALAFHVKVGKLDNAKDIFLYSPKKKEYDPSLESLGERREGRAGAGGRGRAFIRGGMEGAFRDLEAAVGRGRPRSWPAGAMSAAAAAAEAITEVIEVVGATVDLSAVLAEVLAAVAEVVAGALTADVEMRR